MNNYFTLRKANRLRVKLLTEKSRRQIKEVVRYLRRVSWDVCGVGIVQCDLGRENFCGRGETGTETTKLV